MISAPTFVITGMPRARTAWLANYMTAGSVLCKHEALSQFPTPKDCAAWMLGRAASGRPTGMSDSGAVYFSEALAAAMPDARWVVIRRPSLESEASFRDQHGIHLDLSAHKRKVDDSIMRRNPLVVDFDQIDQRIRDIAEHCVPDWVHDEERHSMLLRFNVQLTGPAMEDGIQLVRQSELFRHIEPTAGRKEGN